MFVNCRKSYVDTLTFNVLFMITTTIDTAACRGNLSKQTPEVSIASLTTSWWN